MNHTESEDFERLLELLKAKRGFDFSGYKRGTLARRFSKRMETVGANGYADYARYLDREPAEVDHLFNTVLINVTQFFRDGVPWQYLSEELIPQIIAGRRREEPIRAWSAGCASGEEAYTLAMVFSESLGSDEFLRRVKIYATDVDEEALAQARTGGYTQTQIEPVPELLRDRYFDRRADRYFFKPKLRRTVIFGRNDLTADPPISKIDLLVCRNTLMYFDARTQARILNRFHFALRQGGFLLLGKADTMTSQANKFAPVDLHTRVFTKVVAERKRRRAAADRMRVRNTADSNPGILFDAAFDKSPGAQLVIDVSGNLALANDKARVLFKLSAADIGRPVQDLECAYRPLEIRPVMDQVKEKQRPVRLPEVQWSLGGEDRWYSVQLVPLLVSRTELVGVGVSYEDITQHHNLRIEVERARAELETAYDELRSTNEELETTNEELQSTVEELETANDELQSTNEELETMNQELHATNDELTLFNEELRRRGLELDDANQFLESVFSSLKGGVAVVDRDLKIQVWNRRAEDLWGIRSADAVGALLQKLDIGLDVQKVGELILTALQNGERWHDTTVEAIDSRGGKFMCRVTSTPLIDSRGNAPRGAIIVMEPAGSQ